MSDILPRITAFNANALFDYFYLNERHAVEKQALRLVLEQAQLDFSAENKLKARQSAVQAVIDDVELRYNLFDTHIEDFSEPYGDFKPAPVVFAAICNENLMAICSQIEEQREQSPIELPDMELLDDAREIWNDAIELMARGFDEDNHTSAEAAFLAHILTFEHVDSLLMDIDGLDEDTRRMLENEDIPRTRSFIDTTTQIGKRLSQYIDGLEQHIAAHRPTAKIIRLFASRTPA